VGSSPALSRNCCIRRGRHQGNRILRGAEASGPWHVVFEVDQSDGTAVAHSAFEIFNGVFQAVEEFVEVREPETVVFATKRDKLAGIYQTYLRKESTTLERLVTNWKGRSESSHMWNSR
jgi:hypothetical protein